MIGNFDPRQDLWVLGVNVGLHDASAALLKNGALVAMIEQERLSRNKRALGESPADAIDFCLNFAGISLADVAAVGLGTDLARLRAWQGLTLQETSKGPELDSPVRLFPKQADSGESIPPLVPVDHHFAHAASAFWPSGHDDAAIMVVDNRGEDSSTSLYHGIRGEINLLFRFGVDTSLGLFYRSAAEFAGLYGKYGEVGKLMGLAAYGEPTESVSLEWSSTGPSFKGLSPLPPLRGFELPEYRKNQLLEYFATHAFPFAVGLSDDIMAYANFAASIQKSLELVELKLAEQLKDATRSPVLIITGGVGLNCSANGRIAASGTFDQVVVPPIPHDAGVALGAALEVMRRSDQRLVPGFRMDHAYWGPEFPKELIRTELENARVKYVQLDLDGLTKKVAAALAERKLVGWFQGRSEIGPRALGARSLLGNPTSRETLVRLNTVKSREMWRPLAPSVQRERFFEFFDYPIASPFMTVATQVKKDARPKIPAVVHVDGSSRPQIVDYKVNPMFWNLIESFGELSGVPVLTNTSFNLSGEPIVNSPADAIRDFLKADIDLLAIGNFLASK